MHKKGYIINITLICLIVFTLCFGCSKKDDKEVSTNITSVISKTPIPTEAINLTNTPIPTDIKEEPTKSPALENLKDDNSLEFLEGKARSILTNEWIPEEYVLNRPYAIMFNNIETASPQSGIGEAAILYEALAEGGITRLMGIYDYIDPNGSSAKRLGSIRSARHYFASFADEYEAIFIHFGWTSYAKRKVAKLGLDNVNGTEGCGTSSFYRDSSIKAPNNAFTSIEGIEKGIKNGGYETKLSENFKKHFEFYTEDTTPENGTAANKVVLPFSNYTSPYFKYDKEKGVYTRYQFDKVHTDYNTKEALTFKNIIIQYVVEKNIDKNGYQTMEIEDNEGDGVYITNGVSINITWKKNEKEGFMKYYDIKGNELYINTGKTFIAVYPVSRKDKVTFE